LWHFLFSLLPSGVGWLTKILSRVMNGLTMEFPVTGYAWKLFYDSNEIIGCFRHYLCVSASCERFDFGEACVYSAHQALLMSEIAK